MGRAAAAAGGEGRTGRQVWRERHKPPRLCGDQYRLRLVNRDLAQQESVGHQLSDARVAAVQSQQQGPLEHISDQTGVVTPERHRQLQDGKVLRGTHPERCELLVANLLGRSKQHCSEYQCEVGRQLAVCGRPTPEGAKRVRVCGGGTELHESARSRSVRRASVCHATQCGTRGRVWAGSTPLGSKHIGRDAGSGGRFGIGR